MRQQALWGLWLALLLAAAPPTVHGGRRNYGVSVVAGSSWGARRRDSTQPSSTAPAPLWDSDPPGSNRGSDGSSSSSSGRRSGREGEGCAATTQGGSSSSDDSSATAGSDDSSSSVSSGSGGSGSGGSGSGSRSGSTSSSRHLQQAMSCPDGCAANSCISSGTTGGLRCNRCLNTLVVNKVNGQCACVAGKYSPTANSCNDCPKGSFCPGGDYSVTAPPAKRDCPANMTTLGLRSTSNRACVNLPGYYYTIDSLSGVVGAIQCGPNLYGPGLRKQRACVPCPGGFSTNGLVGRYMPQHCVVPAGYYLKSPGQAAPCPMGEWKSGVGTNASCTRCAFGVTTLNEASTAESDCKALEPGYYAASIVNGIVKAAAVCPQKYYCPGGVATSVFDPANPAALDPLEPSIKACADGTWTLELGSTTATQCLTPPGFYTSGGVTQPCGSGGYRAEWKAAALASSCSSCGQGVFADATDAITVYNISTNEASDLAVTTTSDDCYVQPGQGLYYISTTDSWRARNCNSNNYGVSNRTYGLSAAPCRDCPSGQIASSDAGSYPTSASLYVNNGDGTSGFISVKACVNVAGYGYNGRISQPCDVGAYNAADTYGTCTACPYGMTTSGVGAGITLADCGIAQGFGFHNGSVGPCPKGYYNDVAWVASKTQPCTACPTGTTTSAIGGSGLASCNLCMPGYGGPSCATQCGGTNATYGTPGRAIHSECALCSVQATGFSFEWNGTNDAFNVSAVAPAGASASTECLASFNQAADWAWYLPVTSQAGVVNSSQPTFGSCIAECSNSTCQFATYDYVRQICSLRFAQPVQFIGSPLVAFKATPSGDLGTNSWSRRRLAAAQPQAPGAPQQEGEPADPRVKARAAASGHYSFYIEPNALNVGVQTAPAGAGGFKTLQDCLSTCDDSDYCTGVSIQMIANATRRPTSCKLITGVTSPGVFVRTMVRADTSRIALPDIM